MSVCVCMYVCVDVCVYVYLSSVLTSHNIPSSKSYYIQLVGVEPLPDPLVVQV